jgi:hypothetical protein
MGVFFKAHKRVAKQNVASRFRLSDLNFTPEAVVLFS